MVGNGYMILAKMAIPVHEVIWRKDCSLLSFTP